MHGIIITYWYFVTFIICLTNALFVTKKNKKYYTTLIIPNLAPPPWLYSVVWTILYILMATASWMLHLDLVNINKSWSFELTLFICFLVTSSLFIPIFFVLRRNFEAFIIMLISSGLAIATVYFYFNANFWSGLLFLPTVVWVLFATGISFSILCNNRNGATRREDSIVFLKPNQHLERSTFITENQHHSKKLTSWI